MKKIITVLTLIVFCCSVSLLGQKKSALDLPDEFGGNTLGKSNSNELSQKISNNKIEFTLLAGGYFTVGTTNGLSASPLDDNCQITYGHPYAKTSYPLFSIDDNWYRYDEFFIEAGQTLPEAEDSTLSVIALKEGFFSLEFYMTLQPDGKSVKIVQRIKNLDTLSHTFGSGIVIDPALGKWGDGALMYGDKFLTNDTMLVVDASHPETVLWERSNGAKGIGAELVFNGPVGITLGNWRDIYKNNGLIYTQSEIRKLYDLTIKTFLDTKELLKDEELVTEITISLIEPDFSSKIFTRWDLPAFISIEDGTMFPRSLDTYAALFNTTTSSLNSNLNVQLVNGLTSAATDISISADANKFSYQNIPVNSKISYEDKVSEAVIMVTSNGQMLDEFHRNVFIPSTPVTDTGLVLVNDTLRVSSFPQVELIFSLEKESTGQRVLNLASENIFLYENGIRIEDYSIEKFASGGSNLTDVVFVLDVSGSMGDNIQQVVNYVGEFADSLVKRGFDYQIGIVTFSTTVDKVYDFTKDIELIKQRLANYPLWGGIEDSPAALYRGSELSFRPGSVRNIIWVTDEEYPTTTYTKQQVVDRMLAMDIKVHGVGLTSLKSDWFDPIVIPTGGNFYDIYGNFRDVLLDVSRMKSQDVYLLKFNSKLSNYAGKELKLVIHYDGLGTIKSYSYPSTQAAVTQSALRFYPNPFNPTITFSVSGKGYQNGSIRIFNILGECVKSFSLNEMMFDKISWDARNDLGLPVAAGFYIVQLSLKSNQQKEHIETAKILYLK
ncbi:MAG: VWA domain-containing protein [Ignavibacteriales bacterium]|nr:MAG: VWA domain-containing protein [Ignavibacteriales bacterium]